jgi:hypothetical protein
MPLNSIKNQWRIKLLPFFISKEKLDTIKRDAKFKEFKRLLRDRHDLLLTIDTQQKTIDSLTDEVYRLKQILINNAKEVLTAYENPTKSKEIG